MLPGPDENASSRPVGIAALVIIVVVMTVIAVLVWLGLSVVRCHSAFEWLVRDRECGSGSIVIPALTVPAVIIGGAATWWKQRWLFVWLGAAVTFLPLAAFPFAPYGFGEGQADSLEGQVEDAMKRLPQYEYAFLPARAERGYVVFRVEDPTTGAGTRIAYGGGGSGAARDEDEGCVRPPGVPKKRGRQSKPFAAAGPEPLICFESYKTQRRYDSEEQAIGGLNISNQVSNALCEELYDSWTCFF